MTISPKQRALRRQGIGSSDSPALCGVDPYRSRADVWISKVYDTEDSESSEAIEIGNEFERPLVLWAAKELGVKVERNVTPVDSTKSPFGANLDALVVGKREAIEAKTGSALDYGEPGSDQVPERVIVQAQHQCYVADLDVVWIPVLLARRDHLVREMYRVNRDEELIEMIRTRGVDFWQNHVLPKVKPEGEVPALEVLKRIKRIPKAVATVDEGVCLNYFAASEALRAAEKIADEAKAQVLLAMGEAEAGDWGDATTMLTFYEATREGVDTKRLKAEAPDTWLAYAKPTTYRTLRRAKK